MLVILAILFLAGPVESVAYGEFLVALCRRWIGHVDAPRWTQV